MGQGHVSPISVICPWMGFFSGLVGQVGWSGWVQVGGKDLWESLSRGLGLGLPFTLGFCFRVWTPPFILFFDYLGFDSFLFFFLLQVVEAGVLLDSSHFPALASLVFLLSKKDGVHAS